MANRKLAAYGGAGLVACLAPIGVASWFQSQGLYSASLGTSLTEYFLLLGALGAMRFIKFVVGLLSRGPASSESDQEEPS